MESSSCEGVAIPSTSSVAVQNEVPLLSSGEEGDLEDEAVICQRKNGQTIKCGYLWKSLRV
jgi:hypothetical protein